MLYNKTVDLVAGESYAVPGHAVAISFLVKASTTAKILVSLDNVTFYLWATSVAGADGAAVSSTQAFPYVKFTTLDNSEVQLGICTHKHGS